MEDFPGKRVFYTLMLVPMMIVPAVAGYVFWLFFQSNGPLNAVVSSNHRPAVSSDLACIRIHRARLP